MNNKVLGYSRFIVPVYGSKVTFIVFKNTWRSNKHLKSGVLIQDLIKDGIYIHGLSISENINSEQHFVVIVKKEKEFKRNNSAWVISILTQDILEYKGIDFKRMMLVNLCLSNRSIIYSKSR